jgi:ribose/xylose/arabinose/galactoside ABC-type transport system permease subunit
MMSLAGAIIAGIIVNGGGTIVGMLLAIAVCGFFGLVNGAIISLLRMPSIIVTMITSSLMFAIAYEYTGAKTVPLDSVYAANISMFGYIYLPFVLCAIIAIGTLLIKKAYVQQKTERRIA